MEAVYNLLSHNPCQRLVKEEKKKKDATSWSVTQAKDSVTGNTTITSEIKYNNGSSVKNVKVSSDAIINIRQASRHSVLADNHQEYINTVKETKMKAESTDKEESST